LEASVSRRGEIATLLLVGVGGTLVRLFAALQFRAHVDEGNSLLAARMVAERGVPLLPSGVLYLHGATLSYLASPLILLDGLSNANLLVPRLLSVAAGAASIFLTYRLSRMIVASGWMAVVAAFLVAVDPVSVLWSGRFRMYALLQVIVLVLACCFVAVLSRPVAPRRSLPRLDRALVGVVVSFWLAIFTQLSALLLWPALFLASWVVHGRGLFRDRRDLLGALGLCLLAPLVFLLVGAAIGPGTSTTRSEQAGGISLGSFLGDDEVSVRRLLKPVLDGWLSLFDPGWYALLVPTALAILSGILVGRVLVDAAPQARSTVSRSGAIALLALYWVPIVAFAFIARDPRGRYILYIQPIGAVLVASAISLFLSTIRDARGFGSEARMSIVGALALGGIIVVNLVTGIFTLDDQFLEDEPDPIPALQYVVAHRSPEDFVVVSSPPESYLVLGNTSPVGVIGGALPIRLADGREVDYWIGWPKLGREALCQSLSEYPRTWAVLTASFLEQSTVTAEIMRGTADVVWRADDGMLVLQSRDEAEWDQAARRTCQ
jgi:hypothetical protein